MRKIDTIVIHCTASDNQNQSVEGIRQYHKASRGWSDIGYHYLIDFKGKVYPGRSVEKPGAHVAGHNSHTIGVCLFGLHNFTEAQMRALPVLISEIQKKFGNKLAVKSHNEYTNSKTCPNFMLKDFLKGKLSIIKRY